MKIILSRKGFDDKSGGCASPILPDGTMLSLPIPSDCDAMEYSKLNYGNINYLDLLQQLNPKRTDYNRCHLDPDIRTDICDHSKIKWTPAFGPIDKAQTQLMNAGVTVDDIFLFFGWFHRIMETPNGYRYIRKRDNDNFYYHGDLHAIYGYMQIGKIITDPDEIMKYSWHPHACGNCLHTRTNALYIPTEKLSIMPELPGFGTLNFREDRVLTMENCYSRAKWEPHSFLMPEHIQGNRKNCDSGGTLFYGGRWQELVVNESPDLIGWLKNILK